MVAFWREVTKFMGAAVLRISPRTFHLTDRRIVTSSPRKSFFVPRLVAGLVLSGTSRASGLEKLHFIAFGLGGPFGAQMVCRLTRVLPDRFHCELAQRLLHNLCEFSSRTRVPEMMSLSRTMRHCSSFMNQSAASQFATLAAL